nr:MAG TPA: hypothetical protein [Caudoviricetes sp.]
MNSQCWCQPKGLPNTFLLSFFQYKNHPPYIDIKRMINKTHLLPPYPLTVTTY